MVETIGKIIFIVLFGLFAGGLGMILLAIVIEWLEGEEDV